MKTFTLKLALVILAFGFLMLTGTSVNAQHKTGSKPGTLVSSGYAPVNGLKMYYEIHGKGQPIILLHGSYMTIDLNYSMLIPQLAKTRKVIAIEMQGHGRTADTDRPYSFDAMADDVAELLRYLKIEKADVLGYSFGATIALQVAIKHPQMVNNLVFISSVYKYEGWLQAGRDLFPTIVPEFFENTPLKTDYMRLAPDTSHWRPFVLKLAKFDGLSFDLGAENVKNLKCPVLFIYGDNDGVELNHKTEIYTLCGGGVFGDLTGLPKSQLAIIPATTHVSLMMETDQLMKYINPFLNKKK